jgi:hypothetical protein
MALISGEAFEHPMQGKAQSEQNDWDTNNGPEGSSPVPKLDQSWRRARIDVVKGGNEVIVGPQFRIDECLRTRPDWEHAVTVHNDEMRLRDQDTSKFDI